MKTGIPQHHVNDHIILRLYICIYVFFVEVEKGIFDGGILQIDLNDPNQRNVLINGKNAS